MRRMWNQKDILTYTGRNRISNCVITSLSTSTDAKNANGAKFTMQLQVVNLASSDYVEMGEQLMSAQDAGASTSASSTNQTKATGAEGRKARSAKQFPAAHTLHTSRATRTSLPAAAARTLETPPPSPQRKGERYGRSEID